MKSVCLQVRVCVSVSCQNVQAACFEGRARQRYKILTMNTLKHCRFCIPHIAFHTYIYTYTILAQTAHTWTGCSPACVQPLKPITADGSCGEGWRDRGGRRRRDGLSLSWPPRMLNHCPPRSGQWSECTMQITRYKQL